MKIKTKSQSHRSRNAIIALVTVLIISIASAVLVKAGIIRNPFDSKPAAQTGGSRGNQPAIPTDNTADTEKAPENTAETQPGDSSKPSNATNPDSQNSSAIASFTQTDQEGSVVRIRALIEGSTSGTCGIELSQGNNKITRQAPYTAQASYVICQGFDIPVSEFPSSGTWNIRLTITTANNDKSYAQSSVEVTR